MVAEEKLAGGILTEGEKRKINKAQTPDDLIKIVDDIPRQRRLMDWEKFFTNYDIDKHIQEP